MIHPSTTSRYRWYILILSGLTGALIVAVPSMCLSVLFEEIARDLQLDVVQIGIVWGIGALPGVITVLLGGVISDRFGPRPILILLCIVIGIAGAMRGLAEDFTGLIAVIFLFGFFSPLITTSVLKTVGMWFSREQLPIATGVISMSMALGFMISSLISATVLSPLLGGWRNVLFLYGGISILLAIPWYFSRPFPIVHVSTTTPPSSIRDNLIHVMRLPQIWLLGWALLGFNGCVQGALGYLPLYLRGLGWAPETADGASSLFHLVSLLFVIPIAFGSVRLGSRRMILTTTMIFMAAGVSLLSVASGAVVFVALILAGTVRDGFMAIFFTTLPDIEGITAARVGTAMGVVLACSAVGNLIAPPIGNSLSITAPGLPFLFWAGLALAGILGLYALKERKVVLAAG